MRKNTLQQVSPLVLDLKPSNMAQYKANLIYLGNSVTNKDYRKSSRDETAFPRQGQLCPMSGGGLGGLVKIKTFYKSQTTHSQTAYL